MLAHSSSSGFTSISSSPVLTVRKLSNVPTRKTSEFLLFMMAAFIGISSALLYALATTTMVTSVAWHHRFSLRVQASVAKKWANLRLREGEKSS